MRVLRVIFSLYMTWLLACFMPGHVRGQITMGPRDAEPTAETCCHADAPQQLPEQQPTERDKRNCAVCHWAAGLQLYTPVIFDFAVVDRLDETAVVAVDRMISRLVLRESLARGPPMLHA